MIYLEIILRNAPFIAQGLALTVLTSLATLLISTIIAFLFGTLATSQIWLLRFAIRVYVELFRDIPLLVNIFFVFFAAPVFGLSLSPFASVVTGLSLWGGANGVEIVRGGLRAVPRHQWNSAAALGLTPWKVYLYVIGPQALRSILPPFAGLLTQLVQATSLGALVGMTEFFKAGQIIVERTTVMQGWSPAFAIYGLVLLVYFLMCSGITRLGRWMERYFNRGMRRPAEKKRAAVNIPKVNAI